MGKNVGVPPKWLLLSAYAALYIIWGSTYLAIRFSVETIPPLFSGGIRFLAAGVLLFAARAAKTRDFPDARGWKLAFFASLLPFAVSYGLITAAEKVVPSSIAALLIAVEPALFCLIGWLFFGGKRPLPRHCAGIALGFAGVCLLILRDPNARLSFSGYTLWMLAPLLSSVTWVVGAFISSDPRIHADSLTSSAMLMTCGGAAMLASQYALSAFNGDYPSFGAFSARSAAALAYLIVFGSIVAYSSFIWLMRVEPAYRVSTHAFVNPIVAVILGWLVGGEELHANILTALPFIVASVISMVWEKKEG